MNGTRERPLGGMKFDKDNAKEVVSNFFAPPKPVPFDEFRGKWTNKFQFLLALLAHSISIRTMFLMTYIYINHGGWAVIIPLVMMMWFFYHPILGLKTMLGQFSSRPYAYIFHTLAPPFGGLSNVMYTLNFASLIFYTTVAAYSLVHVFKLIGYMAPWETPLPFTNGTITVSTSYNIYFYKEAVGLLVHYEDPSFRVALMVTVPIIVLVLGIFMYFGHRIIRNAVYVTATLPVLLIVILGIKGHFPTVRDETFKPISADFSLIGKPAAWFWACVLIIHLLGQGHGITTTLASYIDFRQNWSRWLGWLPVVSMLVNMSAVPIFCEFAAFLNHGGVPAGLLKAGGFNLLFLKYADFLEAANMTKFWAALFYIALFLFEFHSMIMQGFTLFQLCTGDTPIKNDDPAAYRKGRIGLLVIFLVILAAFSIGAASKGMLPPCDQLFWFAIIFQMLVIIGELVAAGFYYNFKRLGKDFVFLYGKNHDALAFYATFIALPSYIVILIMLIVKGMPFAPQQYWVVSYGVVVAYVVLAILNVLIVASFHLYRNGIKRDELLRLSVERRAGWEPSDPQHRMEYEGFLMNEETVASA